MTSRNDEYEHQFWEFTAKELFNGFRRVILENIHMDIENINKTLQKKKPEKKLQSSSSCQALANEYVEKTIEHLGSLETCIQDYFCIPPHILLEEDSVQRQQYSDQDKEELNREIKELSERINRVHFMEYHLLLELEKNRELATVSKKVRDLKLPPVDELPSSREVHQILSESVSLEVEEANCHLKDGDSEESSDFSQPNHRLRVFKKRRKRMPVRSV